MKLDLDAKKVALFIALGFAFGFILGGIVVMGDLNSCVAGHNSYVLKVSRACFCPF